MRKGIVDRIANGYAQVEWEDRTMESLPVSAFDEPPAQGDAFAWEKGAGRLLREETEERRENIQRLFDRLKKK